MDLILLEIVVDDDRSPRPGHRVSILLFFSPLVVGYVVHYQWSLVSHVGH